MSLPSIHLALPAGYGIPPRELVTMAQRAEQSGFDGVTCGEFADTNSVAIFGAIAMATSRLTLTTTVISVLTRSPSLLAMTASTLNDLSDGRFRLGLGAGSPIVAGYHRRVFERPASAMEKAVRETKSALAGESLPEWGRFRLRRKPNHTTALLVAAMNDKMLDVASRAADGVIVNLVGTDQIVEIVARVHAVRNRAALPAGFRVMAPLWIDATGNIERARARFAQDMAPYLAVPTYRTAMVALAGEAAVDSAAGIWAEQGRASAADAFPAAIIDAVLITDSQGLSDRLHAMESAGCTDVFVTPLMHEPGQTRDADSVIDMVSNVRSG